MPLVHNCVRSEFDDGLPFGCRCFERMSFREAEQLITKGRACWKKQKRVDGRIVEIKSAIVLVRERPKTTARTITDRDIFKAFVNDDGREQLRIELFRPK